MSRFDSLREPELRHHEVVKQPRENRQQFLLRDRPVTLSANEIRIMQTVGKFRTVNVLDLDGARIERLTALRLVRRHALYQRGKEVRLPVVTLTKKGQELLDGQRDAADAQRYWSGLVKPGEIVHDASIYPAFKDHAASIEQAGGKVRRVVLDYELKSAINSRMNKKDGPDPAKRQAQLAKEYSPPVVDGKLALPDLRIEYEDAEGREQHEDIEITTRHYKGAHAAGKAKTGFKMVRAKYGRSEGVSRASVIDDHHHSWA